MAAIELHVSDEVIAELRSKAEARGTSMDDLAAEALRRGLEEQSWIELLAYGRERGRASGYTEEEVPAIVNDWRKEQRVR